MSADELRLSRLATAWVDRANPILADAQPSGLAGLGDRRQVAVGLAIRRQGVGAARRPGQRPSRDAGSDFAYRRGGATVTTTLTVRDADTGAALDLPGAGAYLIFYPQGAEFRAGRLAAEAPARFAVSLRSFCKLKRSGGGAVVSFIADAAAPDAPHPAPVALTPARRRRRPRPVRRSLPAKPVASRAADAPPVASGPKSR